MSIVLGALLPVGSVIHSMLTEAQFQGLAGSGWVLADGRSCTGTVYNAVTGATTIPDMTGRFLRGKGTNNPDGSLSLGTYTADKFASHNHPATAYSTFNGATSNTGYIPNPYRTDNYDTSSSGQVATQGGNETAPKSITVNIFMRIN